MHELRRRDLLFAHGCVVGGVVWELWRRHLRRRRGSGQLHEVCRRSVPVNHRGVVVLGLRELCRWLLLGAGRCKLVHGLRCWLFPKWRWVHELRCLRYRHLLVDSERRCVRQLRQLPGRRVQWRHGCDRLFKLRGGAVQRGGRRGVHWLLRRQLHCGHGLCELHGLRGGHFLDVGRRWPVVGLLQLRSWHLLRRSGCELCWLRCRDFCCEQRRVRVHELPSGHVPIQRRSISVRKLRRRLLPSLDWKHRFDLLKLRGRAVRSRHWGTELRRLFGWNLLFRWRRGLFVVWGRVLPGKHGGYQLHAVCEQPVLRQHRLCDLHHLLLLRQRHLLVLWGIRLYQLRPRDLRRLYRFARLHVVCCWHVLVCGRCGLHWLQQRVIQRQRQRNKLHFLCRRGLLCGYIDRLFKLQCW